MAKKDRSLNPVEQHKRLEKKKKLQKKKDLKQKAKHKKPPKVIATKFDINDYEEFGVSKRIVGYEESDQEEHEIPIPPGTPPETQGQIYYALDLPVIHLGEAEESEPDFNTMEFPNMPWSKKEQEEEPKPIIYGPRIVPKEAVISAAPQKRDLQKELLSMVPASILKKRQQEI